jgi:hypothetical protein
MDGGLPSRLSLGHRRPIRCGRVVVRRLDGPRRAQLRPCCSWHLGASRADCGTGHVSLRHTDRFVEPRRTARTDRPCGRNRTRRYTPRRKRTCVVVSSVGLRMANPAMIRSGCMPSIHANIASSASCRLVQLAGRSTWFQAAEERFGHRQRCSACDPRFPGDSGGRSACGLGQYEPRCAPVEDAGRIDASDRQLRCALAITMS